MAKSILKDKKQAEKSQSNIIIFIMSKKLTVQKNRMCSSC